MHHYRGHDPSIDFGTTLDGACSGSFWFAMPHMCHMAVEKSNIRVQVSCASCCMAISVLPVEGEVRWRGICQSSQTNKADPGRMVRNKPYLTSMGSRQHTARRAHPCGVEATPWYDSIIQPRPKTKARILTQCNSADRGKVETNLLSSNMVFSPVLSFV